MSCHNFLSGSYEQILRYIGNLRFVLSVRMNRERSKNDMQLDSFKFLLPSAYDWTVARLVHYYVACVERNDKHDNILFGKFLYN
jgi:hypothetical protein